MRVAAYFILRGTAFSYPRKEQIIVPRIVRFHELGDADVLKLEDVSLPHPGRGEVRLRVDALGLNRAEVMFRQGRYIEQPDLPSLLGYEASGIVAAVGEGVFEIRVGERVSTIPSFSMRQYGVYGETAIVPAHAAVRYPPNLSPVEGAAIWMQYLTPYFALHDLGHLQAGQHVLITAASSSVGIATIHLAKAMGAVAIATIRSVDKQQGPKDAGADHVIISDREDVAGRVGEITRGKGAEVIFDAVAGPAFEKLGDAAASGGSIIVYGMLSSGPTVFPLIPALVKNLHIHGYTLFNFTGNPMQGLPGNPEARTRAVQYLYDALQAERLKPQIDRVFPSLDQIQDAHRYMESGQQSGKIVVTVRQ